MLYYYVVDWLATLAAKIGKGTLQQTFFINHINDVTDI